MTQTGWSVEENNKNVEEDESNNQALLCWRQELINVVITGVGERFTCVSTIPPPLEIIIWSGLSLLVVERAAEITKWMFEQVSVTDNVVVTGWSSIIISPPEIWTEQRSILGNLLQITNKTLKWSFFYIVNKIFSSG